MTGCRKTCASDELDCYLLDNNGFIILSENTEHTGKFFGQIDGTIMDSLVQDRIYKRVTIMDYQGVCSDRDNPYTAGGISLYSLKPLHNLLKKIYSYIFIWLTLLPNPINAWPQDNYDYNGEFEDPTYTEYDDDGFEYPLGEDEFEEQFTTPDIVRNFHYMNFIIKL